jgi:anti-sigma factor (TIGR02949 family)
MNCADCQKSLNLYLDGELEPQHLAEIETHLADCPDCRREVENWQRCRDALQQTFPDQTVPSRLWRKIQTAVKTLG